MKTPQFLHMHAPTQVQCIYTHKNTHTFKPWHISSRYDFFHLEFFFFLVSTHSAQNDMTCWDGQGSDRQAQKRKDIKTTLDTSHSQTRRDNTKAGGRGKWGGAGGEREERVSEVESGSRGEGISACDDRMGVFQLFSHLIFGPLVQGFFP